MKPIIRNMLIGVSILMLFGLKPPQAKAQPSYVSFQVFYDELSPYGQWVDYPTYGYVWIPDAGPDFAPYSTDGHWVYTNYGWTWVSDYEWGWAPFHYGRWDYDDYYGWLWVPDNEWGPSWVSWRRANGYYGWSPMQPGMSIDISFNRSYNYGNSHWNFVRDRDFERADLNRYYVDRSRQDLIIRNSTVINTTYIDNSRNTTYVSGPGREDVQRSTGRKVNPVVVQENNKPRTEMNNGQLRVYRPQVARQDANAQKPAPARVTQKQDVKRPAERKATAKPQYNRPAANPGNEQPVNRSQPKENQKTNKPDQNRKIEQPVNRTQPTINQNQAQPAQKRNVEQPVKKTEPKMNQNINKPAQNRNIEQQPAKQQNQRPNAQPAQNNNNNNRSKAVKPAQNSPPRQQQAPAEPRKNINKANPEQPKVTAPSKTSPEKGNRKTGKPARKVKTEETKEPK